MTDNAIAVGTPVFSRTAALKQLLNSVPEYVSTVYIADNGPDDPDRAQLYQQSWPFEVHVCEMEYDVGIGKCRREIADTVEEPYLFVCDSDMEITRADDLRTLRSILTRHDDLGAVAGWLKEGNSVRTGARNLRHDGDTVFKNVAETPEMEGEIPFARFDFIPQAALYRTAIFDTYTYDPKIWNSEHIDFMYGHRKRNEWDFASTPAVLVQHHRDIDPEYRESKRGKNHIDFDVMAEKWGFNEVHPGPRSDWMTTTDQHVFEDLFNIYRRLVPPKLWIPTRKVFRRVVK